MKCIDIIEANREQLEADIAELYRYVIETDGRVSYQVYIWEDGVIERLETASGSNSWLQAKDCETRQLFHVVTIEERGFDWMDYCSDSVPDRDEDPETYDALREETIDWLCSEYDAGDVLDRSIENIRRKYSDDI